MTPELLESLQSLIVVASAFLGLWIIVGLLLCCVLGIHAIKLLLGDLS